jgi:5-methylcytosine-specific restriction endonuclease McrA
LATRPIWHKNKTRIKSERIRLKRELVDLIGGKCVDCGYSAHLAALDFDHVVPSTKVTNLAKLIPTADIAFLKTEAHKCVIRCANCHRIKTHPNATD